MPLKLVIPSLLRVKTDQSSSEEPHPLHSLLQPLLQTARSASSKYHSELPQILKHGGGAGEIEETTMWFALNYEKADDELWARTSAAGLGPWVDEEWLTSWIERMERRESVAFMPSERVGSDTMTINRFQIQILLYFLKLSLPGPIPPSSDLSPKRPERSRKDLQPAAPLPSDEDRLEAFMDKLSMWQLMAKLESTSTSDSISNKDERDWMQIFLEEVVEPECECTIPSRIKVNLT